MGKDKLRRFAENLTFECLVQPRFDEVFGRDHALKGRWHSDFFHNDRPIVLELGCGKGVGFLRTRIELIGSFFAPGEVDEIWITFPDPQLRTKRARKRLTAPGFLAAYARMLAPGGTIHLKTDSKHLYAYTRAVIARFGLPCAEATDDLYGSGRADDVLSVRTAYEQRFLEMGLPITYTRFGLGDRTEFAPFAWEGDDAAEKDNEAERGR